MPNKTEEYDIKGVVVGARPIAVEESAKILKRGGNAVDAAVTWGFVEGIVAPWSGGIGGYGTMMIFMRDSGEKLMIDFYEKAPTAATATMFEPLEVARGGFFAVKNSENEIGYKACCVPGFLAGMYEAHERYGSIPWKEVVKPAIKLANHGYPVFSSHGQIRIPVREAHAKDRKIKFNATAECARIYLKGGEFHEAGDIMLLTDYGNSLEMIAYEGSDVFYRGKIADMIEENFQKNGGLLTKEDLAEYRPTITKPIKSTYRGYTIYTGTPPGSGTFVTFMLNMLEYFEINQLELNFPEYLHLLAKVMDWAFAERAEMWGDPAFLDLPIDRLTSKTYAEECLKVIEKGYSYAQYKEGIDDGTTHASFIDEDGNAVSFTHTLGSGSGVVVPDLGFIFNNGMHRANPFPGHSDSIAPRKSRPSCLSPTIVFKDEEPVFVLGGAGGIGIVGGVLQTLLNVIDNGMGLLEAVSAPRIHSESNLIRAECRIPGETCEMLRARGHKVDRLPYSYGGGHIGNIQAIMLDWEKDKSIGASDPRAGGMPLYS